LLVKIPKKNFESWSTAALAAEFELGVSVGSQKYEEFGTEGSAHKVMKRF